MAADRVRHYLRRAKDFLEGMKRLRTHDESLNSSALLAINSAISYNDALRVGLGGSDVKAEDHAKPAEDLAKLLAARRFKDMKGIEHLRELLSKKSLIAYGSNHRNKQDFLYLVTKAERFAAWANQIGRQLMIEGWRDEGE